MAWTFAIHQACLVAVFVATVLLYYTYQYAYWRRRGVPSPKAQLPFGNLQVFGKRVHSSLFMQRLYKQMRSTGRPFCGIYFFHRPAVLALSLDFVKNVLIRDFAAFQERGVFYNERDDPLSAHLFTIDGARWRALRPKLTPTFSSGRLKYMFPTVLNVAQELRNCVQASIAAASTVSNGSNGGDIFDVKDLLARFTTDVIGMCAFGINCKSLRNPDAQFWRMGKKVFEVPRNAGLKGDFINTFRKWGQRLGMKLHHDDVTAFIARIMRETLNVRECNGTKRNDLIDLLMDIKSSGCLDSTAMGKLTMDGIAAQSLVFFLASFVTSSTALSYALYELALNRNLQRKARLEVQSVLQKHGGELTYEVLTEMRCLENIFNGEHYFGSMTLV